MDAFPLPSTRKIALIDMELPGSMLKIYNSLTNQKDTFIPIEAGKVRMYVCGMTVYDYCHLGHARVMVVFDVVVRYLRSRGYEVTYVRNITDVDDKIIRRANENGEDIHTLTERFISIMNEDAAALGVQPPDMEPRATSSMEDIVAMIKALVENGHAYQGGNGDVYYDVSGFKNYGALSGKNLKTCRPVHGSPSTKPRMTRWTSCSGRSRNRMNPAGLHPGAMADPAGTLSARPCPPAVWAHTSTYTAAVWT